MSGSVLRAGSRVLGDVLITTGGVILLYVVYLLWWTDVVAHQAAQGDMCRLGREWARSVAAAQPRSAQPFATLEIPAIRNPETWPVLDGVEQTELKQGVGWYPSTQLPGQPGNFAVAAHRRTWGDIFRYLNEVKTGDTIVVRAGNTVYTYRIVQNPIFLPPTAVEVLKPIPAHSGLTEPGTYITLTTCDPVYNATRRMAVFGELVSQRTTTSVQVC
ncbi:MAG TPA: class E sortase [Actinocrinis sp.]|nr:class E sortase [Actinocrinis sp.]